RLLDYTIDSLTFKRLHTELETQIQAIDDNMAKLESTRSVDFSLIEEILSLTRNVYQTYKDAKPSIKKNYLKFFFEEILVNDGEIVAVKANPLFESLKGINSVILSNIWLLRVDSNH
ncbi:MAG TPA: hypothetical protein VLI92_00160, partial [Candidatus Saccharimonadales bacterium]|nr:hypothetical protein [Candidatus Saccharimonadales bacterium]